MGTSLAALLAILGFWQGSRNNERSAAAQTHAAAVGVLQDYMKLAIEHPDLANRADAAPVDDRYEWLAAHAYFSAETIYNLTHGEAEWDSTVASIVRLHHGLVRDSKFPCGDYSPRFDSLVKAELKAEFRCAPTN
jgi:hypothetical protein